MNQDSVFINDRSVDLTNNEYQKWQKKDSSSSETTSNEAQHHNVYNGNEGGGKCHQQIKNGIDGMSKTGDNPTKRKLENIEERIESTISQEGKDRISNILNDVNRLSDVEKFLLYLKLPTGSQSEDVLRQTPTSALHSSNRAEQAQAFTWIRSHLEEDNEICVPKHEVFEDYKEYCDSHDRKSLCAADFGKVMKCVFPNVKARRLGQRGQSRYCYSGLRKKLEVQPPALPELEVCPRKLKDEGNEEDELYLASCQLVCEWAQKLIGSHFNSLSELSEHLVGNHYVNSKSMAAFTVLASMQDAGTHNSKVPASVLFSSPSTGNKHRETQLQLQKKLQEREMLKEQKKILQQQRFENEQEHEQLLQAKGLISMPKTTKSSFQTGKGGAVRDISKLLQSPLKESRQRSLSESTSSEGSIISSNGRNTVDISVLNSVKSTDNDSSVIMCSDNINSANSHHNYSVIYTDKSRSSSTSSTSSSQQLYVQNSSVIKIVGQNIEDNRSESQAMDTNEKENDHGPISNYAICVDKSISSENNIFILPSNTPSTRSAFVPVSNQRKELAFLNDPSSNIGVPVVTLSEKIQNDQEMPESIRSENHPFIVDPPVTVLKHDNQGQQSKSLSPQTPRKSTKNRFTPIKPKGVPTNIAKQPIETPTYDSRPVSTILKEKRAKEAKESIQGLSIQTTSQQGTTLPVVSPQFLRIPASSVGTKANDVLIILSSTAQQPIHVKNGSIVSQSHIVTNTAVASLATPIKFTSQITSQQNPVSSSFPPNLHVISSSSIQQSGSKPLTSVSSINATSQDQTKSSQKMPSYYPSFPVSPSKPGEGQIDFCDPETSTNTTDCDITMLEVNRKENDTPTRKRKNSDEGSAISKRMNSMERSEHEFHRAIIRHDNSHSGSQHHKVQDVMGSTHVNTQIGNLSSRLNLESLEHDALLDSSSVPMDKQLYKSVTSSPKTETSSIGINAKSLRPSQNQLMREKRQLDERIYNFLNKLDVEDKENSEKQTEGNTLPDFDAVQITSKSNLKRQQDLNKNSILEKPKVLNYIEQSQEEPNKISKFKSKPPERTKSPEKPKQGNCHPVNLLSLLQQPIKFENPTPRNPQQRKAVVESTMVRSNKVTSNSNHILNRRSEDFSQSKIAEILGRPAKYREPEPDTHIAALKSLDQLSTKCTFDDNIEDGELPNDVAEFVTEALTARAQSRASNYSADGGMESNLNDTSHSLNHSGDLLNCELLWVDPSAVVSKMNSQAADLQEQFIVPNTPPVRQKPVDGSNQKYKTQHSQRSTSMPVFAVPSKPHANPNTILPQTRTEVVSPVQIPHQNQKCISPHDFTNPPRKTVRRLRQPSTDQISIQTPISDAGYHSFNTSPIMNSTPLPNDGVTVTESYIYLRPESAHSIITDPQIVSPISQPSPQHYPSTASTPSSVISPHCLSQSSVNPSPVEYITSPNAFVPIHGLNNGIGTMIHPRIVTPIRPVVTTAADPSTGTAAASATANQLLNIMKKAPGLTKAALQTHQRLLAQQLDPSGFVSLKQNVNNYVVTTNGETVPPNLSLVNSMQLPSESPIQRSPSLSCSTPDDDRIIVSPKPKENISHQRNSSLSRPQALPEVVKPPSYEEALKQMKKNKQKKQQNVSQPSSQPASQLDTTPTSESSQLLTRILTEDTPTATPEPVLSKVYPFSYQLALLHEKVQTPSPKQPCKPIDGDKTLYDISSDINLDSPAGLLQLGSKTLDTDDLESLQAVSGQILIDSRSLASQNQFISEFQNGTDALQNGSYLTLDLPNVNYIGSAPNIDLSNIIHKPNSKSSTVYCDGTTTELRSATIDQTNGITDIDLPPYLDILNLDGQYFSHDDLSIENLHSTLPTVSDQTSSSSSLTASSDLTYNKSARLSS